VNGDLLSPDTEHELADGDQIRIGPYLLQADGTVPSAETLMPAPAPTGQRSSIFSDLLNDDEPRFSPVAPPEQPVLHSAPPMTTTTEVDLLLDDVEPPAPEDPVQALYAGLGAPVPPQPSPAQMKLIGALLRAAVQGTLELLAARNIAKRELGASPTLLQPRENNPLKFSPDADVALFHLLGPAQRGFVPALTALTDAFQDLRAHEVAVLAGMRGALDEVLARFDPEALEQRLAPKGLWDNLLPATRKASLWDNYVAHYQQMLSEIEGDFDTLFGRAFLKAYQAQLARLRSGEAEE
jgi:FHA domain-containing protein